MISLYRIIVKLIGLVDHVVWYIQHLWPEVGGKDVVGKPIKKMARIVLYGEN